ncbi:MAG: ParB/RepB/Spo0J family partition protein [Bacilli bacterium]|nr:ParB/RepB/Spo0J family partition protein [Bacilli bacterium]
MDIEKKITELNLADILPNRFQPRIKFGEDAINELSESIKEHGVIQPIVVRAIGDKYEIIAGERRYKASVLAGRNTIPAIVTDLNDKDSAEVALIENVQRQDLTPIEEAISYKKIIDMGFTQEQLASKLGNKQSTIANKLRLLNLNEDVQEALLEGKISERHARSILRLNSQQQTEILNKVLSERLTVRKTDQEIDKLLNEKSVDTSIDNVEFLDVSLFNQKKEEEPSSVTIDSILGIEPMEERVSPMNNENEQTTLGIFNNSIQFPSGPILNEAIKTPINIPSNPIQDEETPNIPNFEVEIPVDGVNPGFMNIEKIETEAQNINEDKPLADVNLLLQPEPFKNNQDGYDFNLSQSENTSHEPRFFNNFKEENNIEPINNFNFSIEEPKTNEINNNLVMEQPIESEKPLETEIFPQPEITTEAPLESFTPTVPIVKSQPEVFPPTAPIVESQPEPINPITFDIPMENNITSDNQISNEPTNNFDFNIEPINNINSNIGQPVMSETFYQGEKTLKAAIDIIRKCESRIKDIGFEVEIEEIDFEDIYQVIFKINK